MTDNAVSEFATQALALDHYQREADALLRRWSRWRDGDKIAVRHRLGYGLSVLARMLDGMPTTICPSCKGAKRSALPIQYKDKVRIEVVDCPRCAATGRVSAKGTPSAVNPAFILGRPCRLDDTELLEVDRAVCRIPRKLKKVIMYEYVRYPVMLQRDRAKKCGYSEQHFRRLLTMARERVLREITATGDKP